MNFNQEICGVVFDPIKKEKFGARIQVDDGKILRIIEEPGIVAPLILPGLVDSHIHIESSMLTPSSFARAAVKHGTVAVIADPHEIANVAGVQGINYMINDANNSPLKFYFGAPSCIPASPFDECHTPFDYSIIGKLLDRNDIFFLAEMMNFPGVISKSESVLKIIAEAKKRGRPIDGHAPGVKGEGLNEYIKAGITTDHECFSLDEAREKINKGMKILIRDGSAARNFTALHPLIGSNTEAAMFCTDDCHPDELVRGHINLKVKRALELGYDVFDVIRVASVNPIRHYKLDVGLLQEGDPADFIVIDNLKNFKVLYNYIDGTDVLKIKEKQSLAEKIDYVFPSQFDPVKLRVPARTRRVRAIEVVKNELITKQIIVENNDKMLVTKLENDVLKIVVISRYNTNEVAVGLIKGFGLTKGAIAASIAHDSHHIIAIGVDDISISKCINYILSSRGGICYFDGNKLFGLALPVYGLMTNRNAEEAAKAYEDINSRVISDGCTLDAPFMTMSFMSLSVIPEIKITPKGLFDVGVFNYVDQFVEE